ncbi:MAG: hypothetical protein GY953_37900 [bacterium]|nr:hypothetical protein [bacterium]
MATPTRQEKHEALGDLYLSLWKQVDSLSGDGKWLDLGPISPADLKSHTEGAMALVRRWVRDADVLEMAERDYLRTQNVIAAAATSDPDTELPAFKDYLRDQGLRYDEAADDAGEDLAAAAHHTGGD